MYTDFSELVWFLLGALEWKPLSDSTSLVPACKLNVHILINSVQKKSKTSSDVKKVSAAAVSQAAECADQFYFIDISFTWLSLCYLQRRTICVKAVRSHPLKFELLQCRR